MIKSISFSFKSDVKLCPQPLIKVFKAVTKPFPPPVGEFEVLKLTAIFSLVPNLIWL